jgi:hypothetical protein
MTWIKSDPRLPSSPKFLDLVARLQVGPQDAFWNLHHLWYWCSDHYPDGVLKNVSDVAIAYSAKWPGEPKAFVNALVSSGFIDRGDGALFIHDWDQWRSDTARLKTRRTSDKRPTNVGSELSKVSVVVLSFPVSGETKTWQLHEETLLRLQEIYPGLDVLAECKKAQFWAENNPAKRKTARGMTKFLSTWMETAQNRGGRSVPFQKPDKNAEFQQELQRRRDLNERNDQIIANHRARPN